MAGFHFGFALLSSVLLPWQATAAPTIIDANDVAQMSSLGGGWSMPVIRRKTSQLQRRGSVQTTVTVDSNWLIPVSVGTPKQDFYLLPDSGANTLQFLSTRDPTLVKAKEHPKLYDPSKSSTAKQISGYTYSNGYPGYSEGGVVYSDTVYIGDLTIQNQAVEATTHESYPSNYSSENSGSIGFNADASGLSTSPKQLPMWWQNAKSSLKQQLFAVNFHPTADVGTFDLGFVNTSSYTGTLDYEPLIAGASEWYTTIQGLYSKKYGKTPLAVNITVDTGSNYYGGFSYTLLTAWFGQNIPSATYNDTLETWQFSCSETVPDFSFYFGPNEGIKTIKAKFVGKFSPSDNSKVCRTNLYTCSKQAGDTCSFFTQGWIEPLYYVFDWENRRLGIANKPV